jgi:8-oxo-dGTP pyrophosphatase MutT (NUDIX family)
VRLKALVWIVRPGPDGAPEVLLLARPERRGGGEHPVTGKGDEGELATQTAAREAEEETGLRGEIVDLALAHNYSGRKGAFEEHAFLLRAPKDAEARLSDEHVSYRWAPAGEARKAVRWEAHREALERALKAFR